MSQYVGCKVNCLCGNPLSVGTETFLWWERIVVFLLLSSKSMNNCFSREKLSTVTTNLTCSWLIGTKSKQTNKETYVYRYRSILICLWRCKSCTAVHIHAQMIQAQTTVLPMVKRTFLLCFSLTESGTSHTIPGPETRGYLFSEDQICFCFDLGGCLEAVVFVQIALCLPLSPFVPENWHKISYSEVSEHRQNRLTFAAPCVVIWSLNLVRYLWKTRLGMDPVLICLHHGFPAAVSEVWQWGPVQCVDGEEIPWEGRMRSTFLRQLNLSLECWWQWPFTSLALY